MSRDYPRLPIEQFGRQLITSGDLDPIYIALDSALRTGDFSRDQLLRWIAAYSMFYHAGVASYLSEREGHAFWECALVAAANHEPCPTGDRWPRGHERRHFRAAIATDAVTALMNRYGSRPEEFMEYLAYRSTQPGAILEGARGVPDALPFTVVSHRAQEHRGYGPWMGFKLADMVDRVLGVPVSFDQAAVFMFKDPEKAAMMLFEERMVRGAYGTAGVKPKREVILPRIVAYLEQEFSDLKAPPFEDRPINIQEVETVLCKWKSHMNGHYPLYNDVDEIRHGLGPWVPHSVAAQRLLWYMPQREDA